MIPCLVMHCCRRRNGCHTGGVHQDGTGQTETKGGARETLGGDKAWRTRGHRRNIERMRRKVGIFLNYRSPFRMSSQGARRIVGIIGNGVAKVFQNAHFQSLPSAQSIPFWSLRETLPCDKMPNSLTLPRWSEGTMGTLRRRETPSSFLCCGRGMSGFFHQLSLTAF